MTIDMQEEERAANRDAIQTEGSEFDNDPSKRTVALFTQLDRVPSSN